jgi:23S rRNA (guanosine2251-2'-O)-methyltransferase
MPVRIPVDEAAEGVELHVVSNSKLEELSQSAEHQGIVARVSKYPYLSLDEIHELHNPMINSQESQHASPLWVVIDRIQDSFQFASILRCCESASVCGVIVGEYCQAQVTTQIARSCLGAVNHFSIFQSADLSLALRKIKEHGVSIVAYNPEAVQCVGSMSFASGTALLIGSDPQGIASNLLSLSDYQISIPMSVNATSLPATVAAGILLYEIRRK